LQLISFTIIFCCKALYNECFGSKAILIIKIGESNLDTIIGRYVRSKAGRDKDRLMIIIGILDSQHVLVADGILRSVSNPKKKKLKHLFITDRVAEEITNLILTRKKLLDADLKRAVEDYNEELATSL
jgi:large subunit ribosomal protein L14e